MNEQSDVEVLCVLVGCARQPEQPAGLEHRAKILLRRLAQAWGHPGPTPRAGGGGCRIPSPLASGQGTDADLVCSLTVTVAHGVFLRQDEDSMPIKELRRMTA